jgi:hypothetical protein
VKIFIPAFLSAGAAAVALASEPVSAMDYRYHVYEKQIVINASGDIELDEATTFSRWVKNFAPRWGGQSWLRESEQSVEWIFCLTAARVLVANQEQI